MTLTAARTHLVHALEADLIRPFRIAIASNNGVGHGMSAHVS
jgi:hypothetical protein